MKKLILFVSLITLTTVTFCQNNPRPSSSRFWLSKVSTFAVKAGDMLVYEVKSKGKTSDFIVTIKELGDQTRLDYTNQGQGREGAITLTSATQKEGVTYNNIFTDGDNEAKNKNSIWLSKSNYSELESKEKKTDMDWGNGLRTFVREAISTAKIKYKGAEKIITLFKVASKGTGARNELWVMNDAANPLIIKLDNSATITLKEVR